jgi:hypothetical protein
LHDECFQLPHIIVDQDNFSAVTARDIVTRPGAEVPIVFYYTNYQQMFGTFSPVQAELAVSGGNLLRTSFSPRKRYTKFDWLLAEKFKKIWDSQGDQHIAEVRSAVLQATPMKVVFMDEEGVWNIHPVILPQVACHEDTFLLQTGYLTYPQFFRKTDEIETMISSNEELCFYFNDETHCFTNPKSIMTHPFYAFYHLCHDGTYKSYYDLARGDTTHKYQRLMVFVEK